MNDLLSTASRRLRLERAARLLGERLERLETAIHEGQEEAWGPYQEALHTLAALLPHLSPERHGILLTTAEMAARLGVTPKTLLRRKAKGEIRPAVAAGKFLRWRGNEPLDGNADANTVRK